MKKHFKRAFFAFLFVSSVFTFSQRAFAAVTGGYGYHAQSGMEEIYGDYVNSESYSRLDTQEDYDPGFLEFFWDWHLRSETEVQNSQGTVTAASQTPASVAAWVGSGGVSLDLNESVEAFAWTNTQSSYSPDAAKTADISFYHQSDFGLPAGLVGTVDYYFGIWENDLIVDNFMLTEKEGWTISSLDYQGENYSLLRQTYSLGSGTISPDPTVWSLDLEVGQDYNFFSYMVAEAEFVPELFSNPADINNSGAVDPNDLTIFAAAWLSDDTPTGNWNPACDISDPNDGFINGMDFTVLYANWLWTAP